MKAKKNAANEKLERWKTRVQKAKSENRTIVVKLRAGRPFKISSENLINIGEARLTYKANEVTQIISCNSIEYVKFVKLKKKKSAE